MPDFAGFAAVSPNFVVAGSAAADFAVEAAAFGFGFVTVFVGFFAVDSVDFAAVVVAVVVAVAAAALTILRVSSIFRPWDRL